ncbi:hypothetical protein BZY51_26400, partial [Enterobacter hormaechei]
GNQVKIPSEVMIPETREFEFANLGFIPLSYYKNRDYACFFSANSAQKPALYDTADATANSRINAGAALPGGRHGCEPVSGEPDAESESVRR